jgi:hypothetical protein
MNTLNEIQYDSSDDDEYVPDAKEVYFPYEEYKLLTADDLIIGHNYYVIDSSKNGKHILYKRPNQNFSSGPFTYYGKYVESYRQPKLLPELNNEIIFVTTYKFYDKNGDRFSNKFKYTRDNFDKKNIELYKTTNASTYKHHYLYLDEESVTRESPPLVDEVTVVNKSARNILIPRNAKATPVAELLRDESSSDDEDILNLIRVSRPPLGGKKKRKTIRKSKKLPKRKRRKITRRYKRHN